eukprot:CAMPEP_0174232874 /NCGR_PEP_ID=MMETSP0417-20130205/3048_1 /TAXON_ID=242541 /ORGANISM="Mayorella sp, Strain BSH-02190019" /LENGTH=762 /DNA_ID=CAMNT_0015310993 /DNA_START=63 /DNA_END=2348 /DNA_ORIENTATION=-
MPFFQFPYVVNEWPIRLNGLIVCSIAVLGIVFRDEEAMQWVVAGLCVDFLAKIVWGGSATIAPAFGIVFTKWLPVRLTPGSPKQFAGLCGFFFTFLATLLFFAAESPIAASVVLGLLAAASFLEAVFNLCAACLMMGFAIQFGLIDANHTAKCDEFLEETDRMFRERVQTSYPRHNREILVYKLNKDGEPTRVDLRYKQKSDEDRWGDFHPIKHVMISDQGMSMGVAAIAAVWKISSLLDESPRALWITLAIIAASLWGIQTLLYLIKLVIYPKKVYKEWMHPDLSNMFAGLPINLLLFAFLAVGESDVCVQILFWSGAPLSALFAILALGNWFGSSQYYEMMSPSWVIPVVGPLLAALVGPSVPDVDLSNAIWLFFGLPALLGLTLFVLNFRRWALEPPVTDLQEILLFALLAVPSVMTMALPGLTGGFGAASYVTFSISVAMAIWFLWLAVWHNKFSAPADRNYWVLVFSVSAYAGACYTYYQLADPSVLGQIWAYSANFVASYACIVVTLHSLRLMIWRKYYVPADKWGPLSFMKLTHYAYKEALDDLTEMAGTLDADNANEFANTLEGLVLMHHSHAHYEDEILFKDYDGYIPGFQDEIGIESEHQAADSGLDALAAKIEALRSGGSTAGIEEQLAAIVPVLTDHLENEERNLIAYPRKYVARKTHKRLIRESFRARPIEEWRKVLPFIINKLPYHPMRVRFLRCFQWAMPEEMEKLGIMLFNGCSRNMFERVARDVPAIVPRGLYLSKKTLDFNWYR